MDEEQKRELLLKSDEYHRQLLFGLLEERVREAIKAINYQRQQVEYADALWTKKEEEEWLLRVYTQLLSTEDRCARSLARQQSQKEFWALVRAAAEARANMEKIEAARGGGGFAKGVADAMEERSKLARARLRADDTQGGGGDVGAALELAPAPKAAPTSDYDRMRAATLAMRAEDKKPFPKIIIATPDDDTRPGGP